MSIATILTIINIVNGLLTAAKEFPSLLDEARSLLAKVEPFVDQAGSAVRGEFDALKARVA
jgi:hypothetical protein